MVISVGIDWNFLQLVLSYIDPVDHGSFQFISRLVGGRGNAAKIL